MNKNAENSSDARNPRNQPIPLDDPDYEVPSDLILDLLSRMMRKFNQEQNQSEPAQSHDDLPVGE